MISHDSERLTAAVKSQLERFRQSHIPHIHHQHAFEELVDLATCPGSTSIVMLLGPSGAGKSTLLHKFQQVLIEAAQTEMVRDLAHLPFIRINAHATERGSFHFREFFKRILHEANEPCIEHKQTPARKPIDDYSKRILKRSSSTDDLRLAVERCFKYRRIPILIVDDAQHIAKVLKKPQLLGHIDVLKDFAKQTGALLILVGTADMLPLVDLSAQNIRLSWDIEFPHFEWNVEVEQQEFFKTLISLLHFMNTIIPVPGKIYDAYWQEFYSGSLGCVGVLKDWLTRALRMALIQQAPELTLAHCQNTRWSPKLLARMAKELRAGAHAMAERCRLRAQSDDAEPVEPQGKAAQYNTELLTLLGMHSDTTAPSSSTGETTTQVSDPEAIPPKARKPRLPGKRHPKRDPVGVDSHT